MGNNGNRAVHTLVVLRSGLVFTGIAKCPKYRDNNTERRRKKPAATKPKNVLFKEADLWMKMMSRRECKDTVKIS